MTPCGLALPSYSPRDKDTSQQFLPLPSFQSTEKSVETGTGLARAQTASLLMASSQSLKVWPWRTLPPRDTPGLLT